MDYIMIIICVAAVALLWLIVALIMLRPNKRRDMHWMQDEYFAHRGLHSAGVPENSLAAFRAAKSSQIGVELDVQLTRDNQVVVFHDDNLKRMCGVDKMVCDLTYAELSQYTLLDTQEKIPLFRDVLYVLGGVPVICEVKPYSGSAVDELCIRTEAIFRGYKGFLCIESFSPFAVKWFRDNYPDIIRGQLSAPFKAHSSQLSRLESFLMRNLLVNFIGSPDFIAYDYTGDSFGYKLCRRLYKPFRVAWTVRGEAATKAAEGKYDAVIFEL